MEGEGNMRRVLCACLLSVLFLFAPAALAAIGTVNFEVTAVWQGGYEGPLTLTLYANGRKMDPQPVAVFTITMTLPSLSLRESSPPFAIGTE